MTIDIDIYIFLTSLLMEASRTPLRHVLGSKAISSIVILALSGTETEMKMEMETWRGFFFRPNAANFINLFWASKFCDDQNFPGLKLSPKKQRQQKY